MLLHRVAAFLPPFAPNISVSLIGDCTFKFVGGIFNFLEKGRDFAEGLHWQICVLSISDSLLAC